MRPMSVPNHVPGGGMRDMRHKRNDGDDRLHSGGGNGGVRR
ncbi:MAG: hypothetical protein ACRYGL_06155 [Janthinobacterium lividum]